MIDASSLDEDPAPSTLELVLIFTYPLQYSVFSFRFKPEFFFFNVLNLAKTFVTTNLYQV